VTLGLNSIFSKCGMCRVFAQRVTFVDTGKFSDRQVHTVFDLSDYDFEKTMECLLEGPTIQGLVRLHQKMFCGKPAAKFYIDSDDLWPDMVGYYKTGVNTSKPIRVILDEQPAIDTGGVRRQVFSDVFTLFANNKHFRLFEGEHCSLRPVHSANCRSSGLLKVCTGWSGFPISFTSFILVHCSWRSRGTATHWSVRCGNGRCKCDYKGMPGYLLQDVGVWSKEWGQRCINYA